MKIKISLPEWDLSIEIEGKDEMVTSLFDFALKIVLKIKEIVIKSILENRKSCDTLK